MLSREGALNLRIKEVDYSTIFIFRFAFGGFLEVDLIFVDAIGFHQIQMPCQLTQHNSSISKQNTLRCIFSFSLIFIKIKEPANKDKQEQ